ncbi:MAG: leucine-rich repeat protein, partial [Clostridia bacterium]|nr:leucine-rich repeat protein [Clostridia bacterium]
SITIPDSVTSIGEHAFFYCSSLVNIQFAGTTTKWEAISKGMSWDLYAGSYIVYCTDGTISSDGTITSLAEENTDELCLYTVQSVIEFEPGVRSNDESASVGLEFSSYGNGTCYVSGIGTCADTDIVIPSISPSGDKVTSIGNSAFHSCSGLTSVFIPDSVTSIEAGAFYNCTRLTSITVPNSVTNIGDSAFRYCTQLKSITIPFVGADKDGTENTHFGYIFGASSYYDNGSYVPSSLKTVVITGGSNIGNNVFYGCYDLTNITIPDSVTSIGDYAFYHCYGLISITIPGSVTSIGEYAFYDCDGMSVAICEGVKSIGEYAFGSCSDLTSIVIPGSVTSIGEYAFYDCDGLTSVTLCNGVKSIGEYAFSSCYDLTNIVIPSSVISIGKGAFSGCSLESITLPFVGATKDGTTNTHLGYIFGASNYREGYVPYELRTVVVTGGTHIGSYAFYNCDYITTIKLPDCLISIGDNAFYECYDLKSIEIPDSATSIGAYAFYSCWSLASIILPDSVTKIGANAFCDCRELTSITIGNGLKSVGANAFLDCSHLTGVYATDLAAWCGIRFSNPLANPLSYAENLYINGELLTDLVVPDGVTSIGERAFYNCINLTGIVIPDSVMSIGAEAFKNCPSLAHVTVGDGITSIGEEVFYDTAYYNDASNWENGVLHIRKYLIGVKPDKSDEYTIENGTRCIAGEAFKGCNLLTRIIIPESVISIGASAFYGCSGLTSIFIPDSVTGIGANAFSGCTGLSKVIFEGTAIYSIGSQAFAGTALASDGIYYPDEWNAWRFVQKATDWDGGLTTKEHIHCRPAGTILFEMSDDRSEFFVGEYVPTDAEAVIPELFSGRPVTMIYSKVFFNSDVVQKITVPDTVKYIEREAFYNCSSLSEIVIEGSDLQIEKGMISLCERMEKLTVPFLGGGLEDRAGYVGYFFGGDSYKTNGEALPPSMREVYLTAATVIPAHAFEGCAYLTKVILPDEVYLIGDYAFAGCGELEGELILPSALESIGTYSFEDCSSLVAVILPENLEKIGAYAFSGCSRLAALSIPDSVTTVGEMILDGCSGVKSIHIGAGLTALADVAAGNPLFGINKALSSLTGYTVSGGNPALAADGYGVLYELFDGLTDGQGRPVAVAVIDAPAKADLSGYELPEHIVYIGPYAFAYNNSLKWISLERVRRIDNNAFFEASALINVAFGKKNQSIEVDPNADRYQKIIQKIVSAINKAQESDEEYAQSIGAQAFMGCSSLQFVNLYSDFIVSIGDQAFYDCPALTSVSLNRSLEHIGFEAFGGTRLEGITVHSENPHYKSVDKVLYKKLSDGSYRLELYPTHKTTAASSAQTGKVFETTFALPTEIKVSAIESYAFADAVYLDHVVLDPAVSMKVGDYAFAGAQIQTVTIGERVTSLGLIRGEGEYTVFADCAHLTAVNVEGENPYYSSKKGVLLDKDQQKLIKYPAAKADRSYTLPATVSVIASMAFKDAKKLEGVRIASYVHTVGLEAFYGCSSLDTIFFDHVYAPAAVMENAFTTFVGGGEGEDFDPRTVIGYSEGYYLDGEEGEYGWSRYEDSYRLFLTERLTLEERRRGNGYYAVVVADAEGVRMGNTHVTLTDYRGNTERVSTSEDGIAIFYDLFGSEGVGFAIDYTRPYTFRVEDDLGEYFAYTNNAFYPDADMRITYVTLTKIPCIQGVSCGQTDINTERAQINKAQYGYDTFLFDEEGNQLYGVDGQPLTSHVDEQISLTVSGFADKGWSFLRADGSTVGGLYQNGKQVGTLVSFKEEQGGACGIVYDMDISLLLPEVAIEARLTAFSEDGQEIECITLLNVHVFDFIVTEDDVDLDAGDLEMDLSAAGEVFTKLFGEDGMEVKLGKNVKLGVTVEDDTVNMTLTGKKSWEKKNSKLKSYKSYEKGYEDNHNAHNDNTYFFTYTLKYTDENKKDHFLTYNVRFARGTEESNYYFYRCYVYEGEYENEVTTFYGAVNGLDGALASKLKLKTGRARVAAKAFLIVQSHYRTAKKECKNMEALKKLDCAYIEAIKGEPYVENSHSFEIDLDGSMVFKYDRATGGIKPQKSEIKGSVSYTFKHNSQFVVWVIPIVVEVEVKVGGEVDVKLKFDEEGKVSFEEVKLTLSAEMSMRAGAGCSVASIGVYGKVGTVFILEFYPERGVESWTLNGEFGVYMKVLWYKKDLKLFPKKGQDGTITILPKEEKTASVSSLADMQASLYLANSYSSENLDYGEGDVRLVTVGDSLYRVEYVNASALDGYDDFNYRKLAIEKWENGEWSAQRLVDGDSKKNDGSYGLYQVGDRVYLLFTQQTKTMTAELFDDSYAAASDLSLKLADITDPDQPALTTVSEGGRYKYLPALTLVNGKLTVIWAENADNNMFGVSPYNYVNEETGESVVFKTAANALYASTLTKEGVFGKPLLLKDGLSALTDLAVSDDGLLCYLVDENGDLADREDRVLYRLDLKDQSAPEAQNQPEKGSVIAVDWVNDSFIYHYQSKEDAFFGLCYLGSSQEERMPLPEDFAPEGRYRILSDPLGKISAVLYVSAHSVKDETGKESEGSVLYGLFRSGTAWGQPVFLSCYQMRDGAYISSFDACYTAEDRLLITAELSSAQGTLVELATMEYELKAELALEGYEVDYTAGLLHLTVKNDGAVAGDLFVKGHNEDEEGQMLLEGLLPGYARELTLSLENVPTPTPMLFFEDGKGGECFRIDDLSLDHSDVIPMAKQLLLGKTNTLLLGVKNGGTVANGGYLLGRFGNFTAEQMASIDPTALTQVATVKGVAILKDGQGSYFFHVPYRVDPVQESSGSSVLYFELPLSKDYFPNEEGLITVFAHADPALEKGNTAKNNLISLSYKALTGVLEEGEKAEGLLALMEQRATLDVKKEEELTLQGVKPFGNALLDITLEDGTLLKEGEGYLLTEQDTSFTLTLLGKGLKALSEGSHTLTLSFLDGSTLLFTLKVPSYHELTFMVDGTPFGEAVEVKEGEIPQISQPQKAEDEIYTYRFLYWQSHRGTGLYAATEDATYHAVFEAVAKSYTVTWRFLDEQGQMISVDECYPADSQTPPVYKGALPTPEGYTFSGWDKPLEMPQGDVVFTALYIEERAQGDADGDGDVDEDDAVYLLMHVNFPADYPLDGFFDMDGDGDADEDDAVYLLMHVSFPYEYPLPPKSILSAIEKED